MRRPRRPVGTHEPTAKRPCLRLVGRSSTPEEQRGIKMPELSHQDRSLIDFQLTKCLCTILFCTGFTSVQSSALESFRALAEEYMIHYSWRIEQSMLACRRSQILPQDFIYALPLFGLSAVNFTSDFDTSAHLRLSIKPPLTQPLSPEINHVLDATPADMSRSRAREQHIPFAPKHFPTLPRPHTYKDTPAFASRDTDARRVREQATAEGGLAEQALRRLVAARQAGKGYVGERIGSDSAKRSRWPRNQEMWRETMSAVLIMDEVRQLASKSNGLAPATDIAGIDLDANYGAVVNSDRQYWRKGASAIH